MKEEGFAPEFFSRPDSRPVTDSKPNDEEKDGTKWHIWLGGLNSSTEPLPDASKPVSSPPSDDAQIKSLLSVANRFFTYHPKATSGAGDSEHKSEAEGAQLTSAALCFRPATKTGRPIIGRIPPSTYSPSSTESEGEGKGGLFICAGHGPWGIALSLGSGKVISEIMLRGDREKTWEALGLSMNV